MNKKLLALTFGAFLFLSFVASVKAGPEVVFQWENAEVEEEETAYINLYQNFKEPYNFTIISDLVKECWVVKDYYDENKVVCRSEDGLCRSIETLDYQYVRCSTWDIYTEDSGEKAIFFYEYENDMGRQHGIYQTQALIVPTWTGKIVAAGPFMAGIIATLAVLAIILVIIYFAGSYVVSWAREMKSETQTYEELQTVKDQIGKKGQVFSNCIVVC